MERVLRACRADSVLSTGGVVVVGFSGGADSSAMLHALARGARRLRLRLLAAHVDHGVRAGSADDALRALAAAEEMGVEARILRVAPRGRGEEELRSARHAALEALAAAQGARSVALGHTLDDQAETILLHLLRGAGPGGLAGMRPRSGVRFRPLLHVRRADTVEYCELHRLAVVQDPSNSAAGYARNRVRRELIPQLEQSFNPRVVEALARLGAAAEEEHAVVRGLALGWLEQNREPWSVDAFNGLFAAVRVEVLRQAWARRKGGGQLPGGDAALRQAVSRLESGRGMIRIRGGFELHVDGERIYLD